MALLEYYLAAGAAAVALVPAAAAAQLRRILGLLPGGADTFGFEVRLTADGRVDLGVGVNARIGSNPYLTRAAADAEVATAIRGNDCWQRIRRFARDWADPDCPFFARVPFLFLEFDANGVPGPSSVPSVFLGLDWPLDELLPEARRAGREGHHDATPGLAVAREMIASLRHDRLDGAVDALLARCFALVPDGGLILHLAVMLGRPGEGVRLSVMLPRSTAPAYLATLGWQRGLDSLQCVFDRLAGHTDFEATDATVQIDLDVGAELGPAIGLMLRPPQPTAWFGLLDALVQEGLCTADKRDALVAWPGRSIATIDADGGGRRCLMERYIAHAKITCGIDVPLRAKAYFGVTPRFLE